MKKIIGAVIALFAIVFVYLMLSPLMDSIHSFRVDSVSAAISNTTAVGVTNTTQTLQQTLFNNDVTAVTALTSDVSTDNPIASSYISSTKALLITGLTANTTRNLTLAYDSPALSDYAGADEFAKFLPFLVLVAGILILLGIIYKAFR